MSWSVVLCWTGLSFGGVIIWRKVGVGRGCLAHPRGLLEGVGGVLSCEVRGWNRRRSYGVSWIRWRMVDCVLVLLLSGVFGPQMRLSIRWSWCSPHWLSGYGRHAGISMTAAPCCWAAWRSSGWGLLVAMTGVAVSPVAASSMLARRTALAMSF